MRVTSLAAGLLLAVAACGGEKKAPEQTAAADTGAAVAQTPSGQQAMAASGNTVDVNMDFDGKVGKFDPANVTIKSGDVVRFHNHSGGPHNVAFDKDSIPAGAGPVPYLRCANPVSESKSACNQRTCATQVSNRLLSVN